MLIVRFLIGLAYDGGALQSVVHPLLFGGVDVLVGLAVYAAADASAAASLRAVDLDAL